MSSYNLEKYSITELRKMAEKMNITKGKNKKEIMDHISKAFEQSKYKRHYQLGEKGKEGTTFLVTDKRGREYAMKTFRKGKSSNTLYREYSLQHKASKVGVAPRVYNYDTIGKWILMEKMDCHFYEIIEKAKGNITKKQQERLYEIFTKLDKAGVFHNDANICNYMLKNGQIYLIDYGFSKEITPKLKKTLQTETPNARLMLIGLVLKLKEMKLPEKSYKYLIRYISDEDKEKFGLKTQEIKKNALVEQKIRKR